MEMGSPLVSVVVPIYNTEAYLEECVNSLINQTYQFLEILLIDDGSTDGCAVACDDFAQRDARIKVFHEENGGLGKTRNKGISIANGKYILFLDSDDYLDINTVELLVKKSEFMQTELLLFSAQPFFDGISETEVYTPKYEHTVGINSVMDGISSYSQSVEKNEYYASSCLRFYKMEYVLEYDWKFEENVMHEDEAFSFLSYINAKHVALLGDKFYYRRYRKGSIMTSNSLEKSIQGYSMAVRRIMQYYRTHCTAMTDFEQRQYANRIQEYIFLLLQKHEALDIRGSRFARCWKTAKIMKMNCADLSKEIKPVAQYFENCYKPFAGDMFTAYILLKVQQFIGRRLKH